MALQVVERWAAVAEHPGVTALRGVFVAREIADAPALFFAHDYVPAAITLQAAHLRHK